MPESGFVRGTGCNFCARTGYLERIGVYELMEITDGIREMVERCCRLARRMADQLAEGGVQILNDVVLNQVLARFGDDARTQAVIARVQADGTAWMGGTSWHGLGAMRISVSNWSTSDADADASVQAILRAAAEVDRA